MQRDLQPVAEVLKGLARVRIGGKPIETVADQFVERLRQRAVLEFPCFQSQDDARGPPRRDLGQVILHQFGFPPGIVLNRRHEDLRAQRIRQLRRTHYVREHVRPAGRRLKWLAAADRVFRPRQFVELPAGNAVEQPFGAARSQPRCDQNRVGQGIGS